MWNLGWQETMVIFLLALLLFGPKKLPELGKNLAKGLAEFRRHSNDLKSTFDREMANIERETAPIKETAQEISNSTNDYSYYENSYYDSGYDYNSTAATDSPSQDGTVSASAIQGAESPTAAPTATEAVAANGSSAPATEPVHGGEAQQEPVQAAAKTSPVEGPVARG